jgi:predicted DNA-binding antitoxin AbrB/MazE fold protein
MVYTLKTVEAVYEKGYLRPLEPIEQRPGLVYIVTVVDLTAVARRTPSLHNLRGKYRGHLSSSNDFAWRKKEEKILEQ